MGLTLGFNCGYVPFTMTDTDVFLLQLLQALESGLAQEPGECTQDLLDEYTARVSEEIGEDVVSLSDEQIVAYNHDPSYPYWFAAYQHSHAGITREYHLVRPKDDWYQSYLTVHAQFVQDSP